MESRTILTRLGGTNFGKECYFVGSLAKEVSMSDTRGTPTEQKPKRSVLLSGDVQVALIRAVPQSLLVLILAWFLYSNIEEFKTLVRRTTGISFAGLTVQAALSDLKKVEQPWSQDVDIVRDRLAVLWARASHDCYRGARILWVDDVPTNNTGLIRLIKSYGATITTAISHAAALAQLKEGNFDAIISDVGRVDPKDQDGFALAGFIINRWPDDPPPLLYYTIIITDETPRGSHSITSSPAELLINLSDALAKSTRRC